MKAVKYPRLRLVSTIGIAGGVVAIAVAAVMSSGTPFAVGACMVAVGLFGLDLVEQWS